MIKKAALILFTFGVLVGAYLAYTQAFGVLTQYLATAHDDGGMFDEPESASKAKSKQLAAQMFGTDSWVAQDDIKLTYYDASRGSYMYAQEYTLGEGGRQMTIAPFAMVAMSKDEQGHKTVTATRAIIKFNQPYGFFSKTAEPTRVIHAELIGDVRIRDDKGTADNPKDDLLIGPLTGVAFDEKKMQVATKSDVVIQDQDIRITGSEMMIQLRRKAPVLTGPGGMPHPAPNGGSGSGFEAETAFLYHNVAIKIMNVGSGNILPGQSKPDTQGNVPLHLQCVGQMRLDMPKPPPLLLVGPPNPYADPVPTYARFEKNVRVTRGIDLYDQLNSETLFLTLSPDRRAAPLLNADGIPLPSPAVPPTVAAADAAAAPKAGSPMTALKLRTALAQGPAVWVQSESQGLKARCVELKYDKRREEGLPDKTYLNGGTKGRLWVEKVDIVQEGDKAGSIKEVNTLLSLDAEILDYGLGVSKIVARGPGKSESRPSRTASVARVAWFEDQMMLLTTRDGPKVVANIPAAAPLVLAPLRRVITLFGPSKLMDMTSASTLDAKEKIVAEFESGPKVGGKAGTTGADGPSRIKWLEAYDNVHLATTGKTLTAWRKLDARFVPAEVVAGSVATPTPVAPMILAATPAPPPAAAPDATPPEPKPDAPPAPVEGAVDGRANYVYATIQLGSGSTKGEVRDAKLRGGVMVHQEPVPGERAGKNASGEALDLFNQGKGMMKFAVAAEEPQATLPEPRTKLAAGDDAARSRLASSARQIGPRHLARLDFNGKTIESEQILGLDQAANFAWAKGAGVFHQEADQGLLDEKGLASDPKNPKKKTGPEVREQLTATWNDEMKFYGRSRDKAGREVAKIEFRGTSHEVDTPNGQVEFRRGVRVMMPDKAITCDLMDVYLDKTVDLSKASKNTPGVRPPAADEPEPQAEIAMIEAWGDNILEEDRVKYAGVDITSKAMFLGTQTLKNKYRIRHTHVIYDKRTGDFEAAGPGTVYMYAGRLPKGTAERTTARNAPPATGPSTGTPTVKLTKVQFSEFMQGRFGVTREGSENETQTAEFTGNVQAADAIVTHSNSELDFDKLDAKEDAVYLTSEALRVQSLPNPRDPEKRNNLLYAERNAAARTKERLIQADRITYESASGVMYAYGDDGKGVSMTETKSWGQDPNRIPAKTLRYNVLTKQVELDDPQVIQLFDLKSGIRPKPRFPDLGGSPAKPEFKPLPRARPIRPGKTHIERNGSSGR